MLVSLIYYVATLFAGIGFQLLTRWSPGKNVVISFFLTGILPPFLSFGLISGIWIGCAFCTLDSNIRRLSNNAQVHWKQTIIYSLWTFSGFLLTLLFLFKIKLGGFLKTGQSEILAWIFLLILEFCILRIIARSVPNWFRTPLGYRLGFINFIMVFYWIYSYGLFVILLTFCTFMLLFPALLLWMDFSGRDSDLVVMGRE
jgi:hypothetical protein